MTNFTNLKKCFTWLMFIFVLLFLLSCRKDNDLTLTDNTHNNLETKHSESDVLSRNKQIAVAYVHSFAISAGEAVLAMDSDSSRVNYLRRAIDQISFYPDSTGYFYIYDFNCVNIAHARQKVLQGKNLYNYKDSHNNFVIRNLSSAAKAGGGFVEFYWVKPGEKGEKRKLGYVEPIPNTDYFIGTGVYLEGE